ncbi:serine/threonine protein kinase [Candidatus Sumerlaeota bacterium]|nr:serine/threonine protein kinase [Candidatus Sumerlaeota bacterium]
MSDQSHSPEVGAPPPGDRKSSSSQGPTRMVLQPGSTLANSYEIVNQIGEGGMAIVYRANQKSLNRPVAVKALHPKLSKDPEFVKRFEAESGVLATLSHPNVVSIIDRGIQDEVYYFVMEFIDGESLDDKIIANKLNSQLWRDIINACGDALDYIHKRGMVHRDIKPSNIMITQDGRVKLADFGITHIISGDQTVDMSTSSRQMGTTHYMAPEQISDAANVDHRADIYSLAVAFYKMLTRKMAIGEFPAPSLVNTEIPVSVDAVIYQAMAPDRDERYQSAREFCDQLLRALKDSSFNISAILNVRGNTSSLYTGADFTNSTPPGSGDAKKSRTGSHPPISSTQTAKPKMLTPAPVKGMPQGWNKGIANKNLTPLPISRNDRPTPQKTKSPTMIAAVIVAIILGIAALLFLGSKIL